MRSKYIGRTQEQRATPVVEDCWGKGKAGGSLRGNVQRGVGNSSIKACRVVPETEPSSSINRRIGEKKKFKTI